MTITRSTSQVTPGTGPLAAPVRYPALFEMHEDGVVEVYFPEEHGLGFATHGDNWPHAREMAQECLTLMYDGGLESGYPLPDPHPLPEGEGWEWVYVDPRALLALELKNMREFKGLTAEQMAELIGVKDTTYKRWERKRECNATLDTLIRIARALGRHLEVSFR